MSFLPSGWSVVPVRPNRSFDDVFDVVGPMLSQSPSLEKLEPEELRWHLYWYWSRGTMSWTGTGVCLIKLMEGLEDMDEFYVHNPKGQFLFIQEVVSDGPETWQQLFDQLHDTWGDREFVMWDRRDRTKGCPRIYRWDQYLRILKRLTMNKEVSNG